MRGIFPRFVGIALEQLEDRVNPSALSPFTGSHGLDPSQLVIVAPDLVGKVPASELAGATVLNLGQGDDAIRQISAQLSTMRNVGVIRLISHGADGALMLGNQVLDQQVLYSRSSEIAHWGDSLAPDADLLLYGCSVASTADGRAFVGDLAALIGAHAAASTNPTGAGGDIILEYATGQVVHGLSASLADWQLSGLQLPDSPVTSITSAALTTFTVFSSGSFQVTTSGGSPAANNFFITNGVFPAGVTIAASTGVISGIPASGTAGSYSFTINASNGVGAAATQNFTLTVALATQTITWGVPADIVYGTPLGNTQLNATVVGVVGGTAAGGLNYEPAAGELLEAGTSKLTVTAAATLNYEKAVKTVDLVVAKASQTITWADPSAITYGSLLGATQLSATVAGLAGGSAPGALIYAQPTGTLLNAGNQALTVTAAATSNYLEATKSVALVVNKAAQFIIWVNPANITYGALLTVTQLNATAAGSSASGATAPGGLIFSPSLGTSLDAGSQTLSVIAVATSNYLEASKSVMLVVDKATQTITWNDPASIVYGTLLNGPQLNATVKGVTGGSAAGALSYDSGAGTLLNAGSQVLTVTAAATKNYNQAVKSVTIKVEKAPQSIAWDTPANITYGTLLSATQFNAMASGSSTPGATAPGVLVYEPPLGYMLNAGTQALNVTAAATGNYLEAFKSVAIIVEKAHQTITWANPGNIVYGTLLSTTQLNATVKGVAGGSAAGVLVYEPHTGDLLNAGEQTLTVAAGATNNYLVATLTVTLIVDKAPQTITWATPANIVYGTLLDGTQLNATVVGVSVVGASEPGALIYEPHATDLLDAGTRDLTVTASATKNYLEAFKVVKLIVEKASQTISWNNPGNITYGTVLNAAQLNATATGPVGGSVVGGLSYGPTLGALLNAGNQTLTVTAAATSNYLATSKSVTLVVDKAKQTIVWETPAPITYGTPLSATQLNATSAGSTTPGASAPGALIYEPHAGQVLDAGNKTLNVVAAATSNYLEATKSVTLEVDKAAQTITWANPASITYGTPLSATQLNATVVGSSTSGATAPGGLTYNPGSGTVLDAGTQVLQVTAAATNNYLSATKSVTLIVTQAGPGSQTITWATPANITYGTLLSTLQLNATVTASGPSAPGALTYSPAVGALLNAGTQTLLVTAAATNNYAASTQTVTLIVDKALPTITWANPATITYGTPLSTTQLNATVAGSSTTGTTSPGGLTYTPGSGTVLDAGTQTLQVTAAATSNYLAATKSVTLIVTQAGPGSQTITWATPANITYGTLLSDLQLNATVTASGPSAPGALTYSPALGALLNAGTHTLLVTAAATNNYAASTQTVTLIVDKALPTITWANPASITYGTPLSTTQLNATVAGSSTTGTTSPGGLTYTPGSGSVLDAGTQTLKVTAAATSNYLEATKSVTLKVDKAAQNIFWKDPDPITYGVVLTQTSNTSQRLLTTPQLNAIVIVDAGQVSSMSEPGTLVYDPPAGTLLPAGTLPSKLSVKALATSNYLEATKSVTLMVDKAAQTITWADPASITYGTALSTTQLNATVAGSSTTGATAPGGLIYNPGSGTVLDAGTQVLQVTAAATNNYLPATKSVTLVVTQAGQGSQTITWPTPANITYGTLLSDLQLNATVTASGPSAPGALTYSPAKGALLNAGTQTLSVTAAATTNYAASTQTVTLKVDKALQTITWANPAPMSYGTALSATQLNATVAGSSTSGASLPGLLTYTPSAGTVLPLGENKLSVIAAATDNYESASASVVVQVGGVSPAITSPVTTTFLEGILNSFQVTATGNPVPTYTCTGILPKGLVFNGSTGLLSGIAAEGGLGNYPVTITASNGVNPDATQGLTIVVNRYVPVAKGAQLTNPFNLGAGSYVVSLGNGLVLIHNPSGLEQQFQPFPGFTGTLSTSLVDRNGDGEADSVLVAVATGGSPAVLVLDANTGRVAYNFYAFDPGFLGGVSVAGGITAFQGKVTTVVLGGAGPGSEPSVSAFDAVTGVFRQAFYAFAQQYTGGVRVAMGSPDNQGQSLIVVGSGINSNIVTYTLDNPYAALTSFYAFNPVTLYRGTWVAAGDLDGDGVSELVIGAGPGSNGKAEVSVFDLKGKQLANFLAFSQGFTGGVSVAVNDYNSDKKGDIFCSSGAGAPGTFNVFGFPDLQLIDAVFLPTSSLLGTFVGNNPSA